MVVFGCQVQLSITLQPGSAVVLLSTLYRRPIYPKKKKMNEIKRKKKQFHSVIMIKQNKKTVVFRVLYYSILYCFCFFLCSHFNFQHFHCKWLEGFFIHSFIPYVPYMIIHSQIIIIECRNIRNKWKLKIKTENRFAWWLL